MVIMNELLDYLDSYLRTLENLPSTFLVFLSSSCNQRGVLYSFNGISVVDWMLCYVKMYFAEGTSSCVGGWYEARRVLAEMI